MRRAIDALASLRLTLGLLVALAGLFLVGLLVPQRPVLPPAVWASWQESSPGLVRLLELAGLTDVYRSPLAMGLWAIFFANLTVVMVRRIPVVRERVRIDRPIPEPGAAGQVAVREVRLPAGSDVGALGAWLRGLRWSVHVEGSRVRAVRNRFSPAATLLFHLSFFLVAAGGIASHVTRFQGHVDVGEGEEFTGALRQYASPPRLPRLGAPPRVAFTVERIDPEYDGGLAVGLRVKLRTPDFAPRVLEINRPVEVGGAAIVFLRLGVAPGLVLRDSTGAVRFSGLIRLDLLGTEADRFELLGQRVEAVLFPDYFREGDREGTRSPEMRDPVLRLSVTAPSGRRVVSDLRPGEAMALGPYTLTLEGWRYWVRLLVRAERGVAVIWTGFVLGAIALAWRLWFHRRELTVELRVERESVRVRLAGRSDYYRALFEDEVDALARRMARELGGGADRSA